MQINYVTIVSEFFVYFESIMVVMCVNRKNLTKIVFVYVMHPHECVGNEWTGIRVWVMSGLVLACG